jgi:hypothetical protein
VSDAAWAWAALAIYLVGLVLAFGVRTWLQVRRTGTSGFRGIARHRNTVGDGEEGDPL